MNPITSDYHQERSLLCQHLLLINQYDFLVLSVVHHLCPQIVEVEGLTHLVSPLPVSWHGLYLNRNLDT